MTETLSIKVPVAQKARLQALARKRNTTISRLMVEALEKLSRESEAVAPVTCYQLARDLFEKPDKLGASKEGDRSINKNRMRFFGRRPRK